MDELSYTVLERRISQLPDGLVAMLDTPRWLLISNVAGTAGMVLGLLLSLRAQSKRIKGAGSFMHWW